MGQHLAEGESYRHDGRDLSRPGGNPQGHEGDSAAQGSGGRTLAERAGLCGRGRAGRHARNPHPGRGRPVFPSASAAAVPAAERFRVRFRGPFAPRHSARSEAQRGGFRPERHRSAGPLHGRHGGLPRRLRGPLSAVRSPGKFRRQPRLQVSLRRLHPLSAGLSERRAVLYRRLPRGAGRRRNHRQRDRNRQHLHPAVHRAQRHATEDAAGGKRHPLSVLRLGPGPETKRCTRRSWKRSIS